MLFLVDAVLFDSKLTNQSYRSIANRVPHCFRLYRFQHPWCSNWYQVQRVMGRQIQHQTNQQNRFVPTEPIDDVSGDRRTETGREEQRQINGCNFLHRETDALHMHR